MQFVVFLEMIAASAKSNSGARDLTDNTASLGIVVELENIEDSGEDRALTNLRELQRQINALPDKPRGPIQFFVVYDSAIFSAADAQRFIDETGIGANTLFVAESVGAHGIHYYDHKNVGLARCETDNVLFMDSDILIEDGWLASMLSSLDDANVDYVSGNTTIETPRLFDKIYALTVPGFPLQTQNRKGLLETDLIMANSFLLRRSKAPDPLFPRINAYRGHCGIASQKLIRSGVKLYKQYDAIAEHPSQEGYSDYLARAYAEGCDAIALSRYNNRQTTRGKINRSFLGSGIRLVRGITGLVRRTLTKRHAVDLPLWGVPLAIAVGLTYFAVRFVGETAMLINTKLALRFSIAKQVVES